ncbi:MAG: hypothetical protein IT310_11510 [Anaerolineales bacterium]|nr:hypothetical protein [Anaerolineales bacterium]
MNRSLNIQLIPFLKKTALRRGAIFGSILIVALLAFEVFNFGTTSFALSDMLGNLKFAGVSWSTILALAFCGIDFAGVARLFTPEQGRDEPAEVYYLFGAWLLAAAFNAVLTWWGVSVAILNHNAEGGVLLGQATMTKLVPIFVAAMVWLVRVLIIGTFSVAGERLFTLADARNSQTAYRNQPAPAYSQPVYNPAPKPQPQPYRAPKPTPNYPINRPTVEPTYHPVGMSASPMEGRERVERNSYSVRS